jgi:hypothetical protein
MFLACRLSILMAAIAFALSKSAAIMANAIFHDMRSTTACCERGDAPSLIQAISD